MRILSITAQKPNSTGSGVFLTELVKELAAKGQEQAVVAGVYKEDKTEVPENTKIYPVIFKSEELPFPIAGMSDEMPYESTRYCDMTEEMAGQFANVFLTKIRQAVKEFQPDLILSHHLYLLTALVREHFPELPVYGFCHNTDLRQLQKNVLKQEYIKVQIAKLNRIFALHEEQKTQICQMFHVTAEQVEVSGMGYNSHIFRDLHIRKVPGKTKIVFAGKISEKKGVESLIRSLAYLPYEADKLEVYLAGGAGNETEYARICRLAEKAPYPVHFLGKLEQMELAKVYNTCDIFALPSFSEGLPLTVIEALACGDRVVMSDLPGIREWLDTYAPGADIRYVELPRMNRVDEAVREELPAYEKRIAESLQESVEEKCTRPADVSRISWGKIAEKVLV